MPFHQKRLLFDEDTFSSSLLFPQTPHWAEISIQKQLFTRIILCRTCNKRKKSEEHKKWFNWRPERKGFMLIDCHKSFKESISKLKHQAFAYHLGLKKKTKTRFMTSFNIIDEILRDFSSSCFYNFEFFNIRMKNMMRNNVLRNNIGFHQYLSL